jgi:spermidine synthase
MKPLEVLHETRAPDGTTITLARHDREYLILAGGKPLMSSRMHGSEEALATLGCRGITTDQPRVLIGGLGMGFTLRAVLDRLPAESTVVVAELIPAVVEWNRAELGALAGHPLDDRRVRIETEDVAATLRTNPETFDAILLDVDNGPDAFSASGNASLYDAAGIAAARNALRPGGVLAVWSADESKPFRKRLKDAGFTVKAERVRGRLKRGGPRHMILLACPDRP